MKSDTLSVFIEANRFPPAINQHRYSILRAETDAVAERMLIIANNSNDPSRVSHSYEAPETIESPGKHVYELEAHETSPVNQPPPSSQLSEPPFLPRISIMSVFNPFDEPMSPPLSPVPDLLKPAVETDSLPTTPSSSSSQPPTNYLPFIAPTAPFDPYKEKYEDHPAGPYGAQKFKNRQTMTSAPFGFERPVTPSFTDESSSSFAQLSDASSSISSDVVVAAGHDDDYDEERPSSSQNSHSPSRTPLFRPFKIPRKPLPPSAKPFSLVSYTPPGSPPRLESCRDNRSGPEVPSPVPQHPGRALMSTTPTGSPPGDQSVGRQPQTRPNLYKSLPPSPASDDGKQPSPSCSPEIVPRPVTAADRVRGDLRNVKDRFLDKWCKFRR